jgi:Asp-tRNA(Asn)/Glu-tRNA(Gln) amidotransferase C subunit
LSSQTIDGNKYVTFHPNTIIYAVPEGTAAAKEIRSAKIGIVWHTTYTGSSFETMKASYGVDTSKFKKSKSVWSQDAMLRDMTKVTMSKKDTEEVNERLSEIGKLFNQISSSTLKEIESNDELSQTIETYNNSFVRKGEIIKDTRRHADGLIKWIKDKYEKEILKRKSERGKDAQVKKREEILKFFSPQNKQNLIKVFELQKLIVLVKLKLINILNNIKKIDTFVQTTKGFKTTGHEGYVAIDRLGGDAVKIVDRMEFSYNNFSPNILKGWDKPGRS